MLASNTNLKLHLSYFNFNDWLHDNPHFCSLRIEISKTFMPNKYHYISPYNCEAYVILYANKESNLA